MITKESLTLIRATWGHSAVPFVHRWRVCPSTSDSADRIAIARSRIKEAAPTSSPISNPAALPGASASRAGNDPSCVSKYLERRIFPSRLVINTLCIFLSHRSSLQRWYLYFKARKGFLINVYVISHIPSHPASRALVVTPYHNGTPQVPVKQGQVKNTRIHCLHTAVSRFKLSP